MPRNTPFQPTLLSRATGSVLREIVTENAGSVQAYCERHGLDRRNFGRVITGQRDIQRGQLFTYLSLANADMPTFELRVLERMRQMRTWPDLEELSDQPHPK